MPNSQKEYLTKQEFCELCGISESSAYKLMKTEQIHFEKCCDGLLHYCKIPLSEALWYMKLKKKDRTLSCEQTTKLRRYYEIKLCEYEDVITAKDIRTVTGYSKEIIRKWINSGKITGVIVKKKFRIAKEDLITFMVGAYYHNIKRKSEEHLKDLKNISEQYSQL